MADALVAPDAPPELVPHHPPVSRIPPFWGELADLVSPSLGGTVLFATDDWFAAAENIIQDSPPVFKPSKFTEWGKWMDGWETRRKRTAGHDWCILKLGHAGLIWGFEVDTGHFTGNAVPAMSILAFAAAPAGEGGVCEFDEVGLAETRDMAGAASGGGFAASVEVLQSVASLQTESWTELLPVTKLDPGYQQTRHHCFSVPTKLVASPSGRAWTHLRVNYFPDGGVARLRVRGEVVRTLSSGALCDMAAVANGGVAIGASNVHYGRPSNMIAPGRAAKMDEGWETARHPNRPPVLELDPASGKIALTEDQVDWAVLRLSASTVVSEVEIDTNHYKGNCPESCELHGAVLDLRGCRREDEAAACLTANWLPLLPRAGLRPHTRCPLLLCTAHHPMSLLRTITTACYRLCCVLAEACVLAGYCQALFLGWRLLHGCCRRKYQAGNAASDGEHNLHSSCAIPSNTWSCCYCARVAIR